MIGEQRQHKKGRPRAGLFLVIGVVIF